MMACATSLAAGPRRTPGGTRRGRGSRGTCGTWGESRGREPGREPGTGGGNAGRDEGVGPVSGEGVGEGRVCGCISTAFRPESAD